MSNKIASDSTYDNLHKEEQMEVIMATPSKTIQSDEDGYSMLFFSQDYLVVGKNDAKINIYSYSKNELKLVHTIIAHFNPVYTVCISQETLFTGESSENALIKIWNLKDGSLIRALKGHTSSITCLTALSKQLVASSSCDCTVRVWQLQHTDEKQHVLKHEFPVLAVHFLNPDLILCGGDDCLLTLWNWHNHNRIRSLLSHTNSVKFITQVDDQIVTGGGDGLLKVSSCVDLIRLAETPIIPESTNIEVSTQSLHYFSIIKKTLITSDNEGKVFAIKGTKVSRLDINLPYYEYLAGLVMISERELLLASMNVRSYELFNDKEEELVIVSEDLV